MPLALVFYDHDPNRLSPALVAKLCERLPNIVAQQLHVPRGPRSHRTELDDVVRVEPVSMANAIGRVDVLVAAANLPQRRENLNVRCSRIRDAVCQLIERCAEDADIEPPSCGSVQLSLLQGSNAYFALWSV